MADDGTDVANGTQSQEETSDIPKYDLYIRVRSSPFSILSVELFYGFIQEAYSSFQCSTFSSLTGFTKLAVACLRSNDQNWVNIFTTASNYDYSRNRF